MFSQNRIFHSKNSEKNQCFIKEGNITFAVKLKLGL